MTNRFQKPVTGFCTNLLKICKNDHWKILRVFSPGFHQTGLKKPVNRFETGFEIFLKLFSKCLNFYLFQIFSKNYHQ